MVDFAPDVRAFGRLNLDGGNCPEDRQRRARRSL
jgi:hypothetical protein